MYQHILLATELGDKNRYVEDQTAAMQKYTNAKLSVIHVIEPLPAVYGVGEIGITNDYRLTGDNLAENARKSLQPVIDRLGIPQSNLIIGKGNVSAEILLYAEENDVDLIITGSHGRHGLQLLLGSTANAILHGTKCDVLAVRLKK